MLDEDRSDANVLPERLNFTIKSIEVSEIKSMYRYVIGGHRDLLKNIMVHTESTLQQQ